MAKLMCAGWEPYILHDVGHGSWVGSVLHRSCTAPHTGDIDDLYAVDRDLSDLSDVFVDCRDGAFLPYGQFRVPDSRRT